METTRENQDSQIRRKYDKLDEEYWQELKSLYQEYNLEPKDLVQNYLSFIQRRDLPRLLTFYELFKIIQELPGSIAELGVFKGNGLFTWGNLLETFSPGDRIRKVFGFDHFTGYSKFSKEDNTAKNFVAEHNHVLDFDFNFIERLNNLHNNDNILRGVKRTFLINGDIKKTVPEFVKKSKGLRLSLLYLDVNLYEPSKIAIDYLYPLVVPGGVIAFTGYGQSPWEGEGLALEELFKKLNYTPKIKRFRFSTIPSGYFIKK